jgi:hypothetical protein
VVKPRFKDDDEARKRKWETTSSYGGRCWHDQRAKLFLAHTGS